MHGSSRCSRSKAQRAPQVRHVHLLTLLRLNLAMSEGDGAPPKEEKSLMHKLSSLKRRSLQTVAAKLGIAGETQDVFYNEHFERFAAYEQELKSLRVNLGQLIKMNKDLLLHKKKTAEQLGCMVPTAPFIQCIFVTFEQVPVGEELHKVSKAIIEISDSSVDSFDYNVSGQFQTHVLDSIDKELAYHTELHALHQRRERKRKDFDAFRHELNELNKKPPGHKDLPAAKERFERSDRE
jgi:hypothetical protein